MLYTAAHGVRDGFLAQLERWMLVIPGALALTAIVSLLLLSPGQSTHKSTTNGTGSAQGTVHTTNTSARTADKPEQSSGGHTTQAVNTTTGTAAPSSGVTAKRSVTTANTSPVSSTGTAPTNNVIGGKGGDAPASSTGTTSTPTTSSTGSSTTGSGTSGSGSGLTVPLTVCVGSKDTSTTLLGLTLDPVCVN